jgi:EAL domain-containing protein (putative c-di-GMP-specific phosphodiesterase class I)
MEKSLLYLISVDLYNMPYISRIFGIKSSNMLMYEIAKFLKGDSKKVWVFRTTDTRFVVISLDEENHDCIKRRIHERFKQPWNINLSQIIPSIAICSITRQGIWDFGLDNLANLMDIALTNAVRNNGKNPLAMINECDINEFSYILDTETALHEALFEKDGLCMYFQPIYSLDVKKFIGLEALVRFNHPKYGLLLPSEFLHIAEKNGHMQKLDQIVVKKVCDFINEYRPFETMNMQFVCINLSAAEFVSNKMPKKLTEYLKENISDPGKIIFEVTETVAASSKQNLLDCMNQYISLGYRFALDDFGTGYANITQAIEMPFSMIKIDQSLLTAASSILHDILNIMKTLNKETLIEGVETQEQLKVIKELNSGLVQGFYFAKPMDISSLISFISDYNATDL